MSAGKLQEKEGWAYVVARLVARRGKISWVRGDALQNA